MSRKNLKIMDKTKLFEIDENTQKEISKLFGKRQSQQLQNKDPDIQIEKQDDPQPEVKPMLRRQSQRLQNIDPVIQIEKQDDPLPEEKPLPKGRGGGEKKQPKKEKKQPNKDKKFPLKKEKLIVREKRKSCEDLNVICSKEDLLKFYDNHLLNTQITFSKPISKEQTQIPKELNYSIHANLKESDILNTFNYLFDHMKIGIFVQIQDNTLKHFQPFDNKEYENNWDNLNIQFKNNVSKDEYYKKKMKKYPNDMNSNLKNVQKNFKKWSSNNCFIGNWNNDDEIGTKGWNELKEMLNDVCRFNKVNDCIFFINRRDHPVITGNGNEESYGMEPYFHVFNNLTTPLPDRHRHEKYVPVLSYSKNDNYADLLIPNYEDINRIKALEDDTFPKVVDAYMKHHKFKTTQEQNDGRTFIENIWNREKENNNLDTYIQHHYENKHEWNNKKEKALFRGTTTGCGTTASNNQRLRLAVISQKEEMKDLADVCLTGVNLRDRKFENKQIDYIDYKKYNIKKFTPKQLQEQNITKDIDEQSKFKYIIHVDGHVSAYRLGKELSMGSTILKVDSLYDYKLWFSDHLIEYYHYLPIKSDLSDLKNAINNCKENDMICERIAKNAQELFHKIINRKYISMYVANLINSISNNYDI